MDEIVQIARSPHTRAYVFSFLVTLLLLFSLAGRWTPSSGLRAAPADGPRGDARADLSQLFPAAAAAAPVEVVAPVTAPLTVTAASVVNDARTAALVRERGIAALAGGAAGAATAAAPAPAPIGGEPMDASSSAAPSPSLISSILAMFSPSVPTGGGEAATAATEPSAGAGAGAGADAGSSAAEVGVTGPADEDGFVDSVDNLRGPRVKLPWVPRRSQATLSLGTRDGRNATLIVDNWFGGHHSGDAVKWGSLSNGSELVGPAATLGSHKDAPPLPTCEALSPGRTLLNPLVATNAEFPDYEGLSLLVKNGADDGGWPAGVGSPSVVGVKDPHSVVRGLPWHRLAHNETADFLGLESSDSLDILYASMTDRSRARYCAVNGEGINPDFRPRVSCDGTTTNGPSVRYPYCNRATAPVAIVSFDCAIVESGAYNSVIVFNVLTFDGGGRVITYNYHRPHAHPRWSLPTDRPVTEFEELACVGTSVYPNAPGHLFNEILPRLIHMDTVLPLQIPMLWPPGDLPARVLVSLRENGLISADRVFIMGTGGADLWRAKRLYVYASDYFAGHTPLILATSQRVLAARLQTLAERKDAMLLASLAPGMAPPAPLRHGGIVVLLRNPGEARAMNNEAALLDALRAAHPGVKIDAFIPGSAGHSYVECASLVYGARVVIGPHGANLNNFVGALPGTFIIEIGYSDNGSPLPSDYFCQARNLGLRYWLSMADSGCYGCGMQVNVDDILEITKQAFA